MRCQESLPPGSAKELSLHSHVCAGILPPAACSSGAAVLVELAMIRFECPMCGNPLRIHDSQGGKALPCPACEHRVIIPKAAPAQSPISGSQFRQPLGASSNSMLA